MKKSFLIYQDWEETIDQLTDSQAGQLFKAMFDHSRGEEVMLKHAIALVFISIRQMMDRNKKHYQEKVEKLSANAKKRWNQPQENAIASKSIQLHTNEGVKDKDKDIYKDTNNKKTLPLKEKELTPDLVNKIWAELEKASDQEIAKKRRPI